MKAKTFIRNLSQCIFEEYKTEIPKEDLKSSFVEAIKNISAGKLQDDLNNNFDKHLNKLEKSLKNLCVQELPSVSTVVDDSLEELTKSELDGRTDVEEHSTKHVHKLLYNLVGRELRAPGVEAMEKLDSEQRLFVYKMFLQKLLNKEKVTDTFIKTVIQQFDDLCQVSQTKTAGKSRFDWFPVCDLLLQLVTGSKPVAYIRVLKILFDAIQNDVNKCLANQKPVRAEKLSKVLKKFLTVAHLGVNQKTMKEQETKTYCRYMAALLSFYVDLCCAFSSKVAKKKLFGQELASFVCYLLQPWPESLLEVALQLQGLEDANYSILWPLINKSLERKPSGPDHVYYLKYVLLVRQIKDAYGEVEDVQEWNFATKSIPAESGFLDWLLEQCPAAEEHLPVEDKKFKKTKITRFILEEAEDDLITVLLNSLSKDDDEQEDETPAPEKEATRTDVTMETENLFYLDTAPGSEILELACEASFSNAPVSRQKSEKASRLKHKPIVLKTLEEVEKLVDTEVQGSGNSSPQTYTLDPQFVMEKVKDPEDRKFLQSEIISITSMSSLSQGEEMVVDNEESVATVGNEETNKDNSYDSTDKWMQSSSSTPNREPKCSKIGKKKKLQTTDQSDISEIDKTVESIDSVTSASEDEHKVKSVVRKVTPRKMKGKTLKTGQMNQSVSEETEIKLRNTEVNVNSVESSASGAHAAKIDIKRQADMVISIDSDDGMEAKDNVTELSCDMETTKPTEDENESLSTVHESSAEVVDIVLEPDEQMKTENTQDGNMSTEDKMGKELPGRKRETPKKGAKTPSPLEKVSSPVTVNSSRTGDSSMSESNLSCISVFSGTTSVTVDDSCVSTSGETSSADQNSTLKGSELDNTVKHIEEMPEGTVSLISSESGSDSYILNDKPRRSSKKSVVDEREEKAASRKSSSGNEKQTDIVSPERTRRLSRKSSSGEGKEELFKGQDDQSDSRASKSRPVRSSRKSSSGKEKEGLIDALQKDAESPLKSPTSPQKGVREFSEMQTEDESDMDVFKKTPEKKHKTPPSANNTKSIEEKFIGKATKGKKTPKKLRGETELSKTQEGFGSESLFPDDTSEDVTNERRAKTDQVPSQRNKSTEEIFQIVEEIKEKIKTPRTVKSASRTTEKLNESMFTDESVESSQEELNVSTKELKSPDRKRKSKSDSESDNKRKSKSGSMSSPESKKIDSDKGERTVSSEKKDLVISPRQTDKSKNKTLSKQGSPQASENDNVVVIDLNEDKEIGNQNESEVQVEHGTVEISEINVEQSEKDSKKSSDINKNGNATDSVMIGGAKSPSENSPIKGRRSLNKTGFSETETAGLKSPSQTSQSKLGTGANTASGIKEVTETDIEQSKKVRITPNKADLSDAVNNCEIICPDSDQESEVKDNIEIVTDSETDTEVTRNEIPKESSVMTDSETDTETTNAKSKTPSKQLDENIESPVKSGKKRTPKSTSKAEKHNETMKTPTGSVDKEINLESSSKSSIESEKSVTPKSASKNSKESEKSVTPKSASKSSKESEKSVTPKSASKSLKESEKSVTPKSASENINQQSAASGLVKTPKSDKKKSLLSPNKSKSALEEKSFEDSPRKGENSADSEKDFVPSSQKRSRTKLKIEGADRKEETVLLSSSDESDEEIDTLPDMSVHLKSNTKKSDTLNTKSPSYAPSNSEAEVEMSPKKRNENTPQRGKRPSQKTKTPPPSPANGTDQDTTSKRRQTRNKGPVEPTTDTVEKESAADGPSRPKRLRSATKAQPEATEAKAAATKGRATRGQKNLNKVYEPQSESDTCDVSDIEPKRTRKSVGGRKMVTIKDKIPEAVDEEPERLLSTPKAKVTTQRKVSASTSKKTVKKVDALRGTRKRRLSGELSDQGSAGNTTDSDVSFPKMKAVTASEKKVSKRLSTPAFQAQKEPSVDNAGRRYSLRRK